MLYALLYPSSSVALAAIGWRRGSMFGPMMWANVLALAAPPVVSQSDLPAAAEAHCCCVQGIMVARYRVEPITAQLMALFLWLAGPSVYSLVHHVRCFGLKLLPALAVAIPGIHQSSAFDSRLRGAGRCAVGT